MRVRDLLLATGPLLLLLAVHQTAGAVSKCAEGCTERGVCNEELGRCDCPRHLAGPSCNESVSTPEAACKRYGYSASQDCNAETPGLCLNNCTGRGACFSGWCRCSPGFYGADCSLSLDSEGRPEQLTGLGYQPSPNPPRIYIYELPPAYNTWYNIDKFDRPLFAHLWKRIISSGHRTLDPDTADYYYVPTDFRYLRHRSAEALRYIWRTWPHWNRTGGARHLLLSTSDLGGCEGRDLMRVRNATSKAIWLTAWGLTRKHPKVWWPGCHRPGLDIVIPIPALSPGQLTSPLNVAVRDPPPRNMTFFFSGKICGDNQVPKAPGSPWPICQTPFNPLYSAGMRQQVYFHHAARPGYKVVTSSPTYNRDMASSVFCLAPTGGGHGKRQVLVARFGCIPVPITDYVLQPYEPELDWLEFSVSVSESDVPRLHEILTSIPADRVERMQRALSCAARHLTWSSMWGALFGEDGRYDAFATLMEILAARLRHPDTPPQDLIKVDPHFAKFARCELGDDTEAARKALASGPVRSNKGQDAAPKAGLCYYASVAGGDAHSLTPTGMCHMRKWRTYGHPGGAVCQGYDNIAQCPRPWQ